MGKNKDMPFWDHVYELRNRSLIVIISIIIFSVGGYFSFPYIIDVIVDTIGEKLYAVTVTEGFLTRFKVSIILGLLISLPVLIFEILAFVFPALRKKEKYFIFITIFFSFLLFTFGIIFSYKLVLPLSLRFLKSDFFFPGNVNRLISYGKFITFFFQFLLAFGICFQFPVVIILLLKLGIIKQSFLIKNFKYFLVLCFTVSAILTPPDISSQLLLGLPLLILYISCIVIAKIFKLGL